MRPHLRVSLTALTLALGLAACAAEESAPPRETAETTERTAAIPVIDVEATEFYFTAPPTFPAGWVTLRFDNQGEETHFLMLYRLPEGVEFGDYTSQVSAPFELLYAKYRAGELEQAAFLDQLLAALPDWFGEIEHRGGPGFTAPGRTSQTTVHLEPGEYVMECYVRAKDAGDTFHGTHGMLRPLIVAGEAGKAAAPEADLEITLSNYEIAVRGEPAAGEQTVRVVVAEEPEGLIGHNIHLARLPEGVSGEEVAAWMDWVDEMLPPAPAEFLGGAGQLRAGGESFFTAALEPGRYAWVSETWGREGMVIEFTVD